MIRVSGAIHNIISPIMVTWLEIFLYVSSCGSGRDFSNWEEFSHFITLIIPFIKKGNTLQTPIKQASQTQFITFVGGSAKKVGKRIKELERIYGVKQGNNQHSSLPNNSVSSQSDIATQMGISVDTLQNYKKLTEMIPELEELVDTDIVTKAILDWLNCG